MPGIVEVDTPRRMGPLVAVVLVGCRRLPGHDATEQLPQVARLTEAGVEVIVEAWAALAVPAYQGDRSAVAAPQAGDGVNFEFPGMLSGQFLRRIDHSGRAAEMAGHALADVGGHFRRLLTREMREERRHFLDA